MVDSISLTVLMAVWNSPLDELEQAVASILKQTFSEFEFLIVDDGSTDPGVRQYLETLAARDGRVRTVRLSHRGLTACLNEGLRRARGVLVARQDADDWSAPERLTRQVQFFCEHPGAVLCGTDAWTHQQTGRKLWRTRLPRTSPEIAAAFTRGNPFVHGSTMFSRQAARAIGGYSEDFKSSQDYDFFWRLSEQGPAVNLGEPLYHYRYSAGSISASKAAEQRAAHRAAQRLAQARSRGVPQDPAAAMAEARREIDREGVAGRALLKQADHLMLAGAYRRAGRAYLDWLRRHPLSPLAWAKLVRLGVFVTVPGAREVCFR